MTDTKTQIDRLGDRLRTGTRSEADLRQLDVYRRTFATAYERVVSLVRDELGIEVAGRSEKSTPSIVDKLQRESIRLSQMQDIAGCRIVVADVTAQNQVVARLLTLVPGAEVADRRENPSHRYRAVHVLCRVDDRRVEIQIRTEPQHLWAEISEKLADLLDPEIKYGGGFPSVQKFLTTMSKRIEEMETLIALRAATLEAGEFTTLPPELLERLAEYERKIGLARLELDSIHQTLVSVPAKPK